MAEHFNLGQAARKIGCRPRDLSDRFYDGRLTDQHCQFIAGKRFIRADQLPAIAAILRRSASRSQGK
jgi:hypothetical protein